MFLCFHLKKDYLNGAYVGAIFLNNRENPCFKIYLCTCGLGLTSGAAIKIEMSTSQKPVVFWEKVASLYVVFIVAVASPNVTSLSRWDNITLTSGNEVSIRIAKYYQAHSAVLCSLSLTL